MSERQKIGEVTAPAGQAAISDEPELRDPPPLPTATETDLDSKLADAVSAFAILEKDSDFGIAESRPLADLRKLDLL